MTNTDNPTADREKLIAEAKSRMRGEIHMPGRVFLSGVVDALAAQPVLDQGDYHEGLEEGIKIGRSEMRLDPEKVAEWLGTEMPRKSRDETYGQYDRRCARALCEAAKRGELS